MSLLTATITIAASLTAQASSLAQDGSSEPQAPNVPQSGEHFRFLASFGPEWNFLGIDEEAGLITVAHRESERLTLLDIDGEQVLDGSFDAVEIHGAEFVSVYRKDLDEWRLIHLASRFDWSGAYAFQFLDGGEVVHYPDKGQAYVSEKPTPGEPLAPLLGPFEAIVPNSPKTVLARRGGLWGWVGLDDRSQRSFEYERCDRLDDFVRATRTTPEGGGPDQGRVGLFTLDGLSLMPCKYVRIDEPVDDVCTWRADDGRCGATDLRTGRVVLELADSASFTYDLANVDGNSFRVATTPRPDAEDEPLFSVEQASYRIYRRGFGYLSEAGFWRIRPILTSAGPVYVTRQTKPVAGRGHELRNAEFQVIAEHANEVIPAGDLLFLEPSLADSDIKPRLITHDGRILLDEDAYVGAVPKVDSDEKGGECLEYHGRIPALLVGDFGPESAGSKRFAFLDMSGEVAIEPRFHEVSFFCSSGLAAARVPSGWGLIDRDGEFIVHPGVHERVSLLTDLPFAVLWGGGSISLYDARGVELFEGGEGITLRVLSSDRFLAIEVDEGRPGRSFLYAISGS